MDRRVLAEKLLEAGSAKEREGLVLDNPDIADEELAYRLKEICYETWNNEPVKARAAAESIEALASISGSPEVGAVACWVSGISELTKGELEPAVRSLHESCDRFSAIGKAYEAAQASVAMLIPLALLGRYDEAVATGIGALEAFETNSDLLGAGKIELNLSNIASRKGELSEAERYGISARNRFIKAKEPEWQALAENDLAHTYTELNDFRKAEEHYAAALDTARKAGMKVTEAEIEASLGNLAAFRGRYDEALRYLEHSRRKFEALEMPHQAAIADLEIAEIYQTLNLLEESAEIQQRAAGELSRLKLRGEEARSRSDLGRVLIDLGRRSDASEELERAADLFGAEGNPYHLASVRIYQARIESAGGDLEAALLTLNGAIELADGNVRLGLEAAAFRGEILRKLGRTGEAEEELRTSRLKAMESDLPKIALSAINSLGLLEADRDRPEAAEREFLDAVSLVESMRAPIAAEEFRMAYLSDKLAPYDNLTSIYLKAGRDREAFEMAERARSRTLAEAVLQAETADDAQKDSELNDEIKELREELNWFYSRLNRAEDEEIEDLKREAALRERKLADSSRRIASTSGRAAGGAKGDFSTDDLIARLGPRRALVEYIDRDGMFSAFVVTSEGVRHVDSVATAEEVSGAIESLQFQFGAMRYGGDAAARFGASLKARADDCLVDLYDLVLSPLEDLIGDRDLVVVPSGALNYVPFPALRDGELYEAEKREIVSAPGAAVWDVLAAREVPEPVSALVVGFADEQIPNVESETSAVAALFRESRVLTGSEATFGNYVSLASDYRVVHIACHGRFRPDNPLFSSLHLSDGFITVRDICAQRLNASIVTLSACETGLNKVYPGSEILGLARGFLTAGAASIVLSLWTVNDEATARMMAGMYRGLQRGLSVSASLNLERRRLIDEGAHPYFWAPFGIIGRQ